MRLRTSDLPTIWNTSACAFCDARRVHWPIVLEACGFGQARDPGLMRSIRVVAI
ncbi:MAG: hypothetical protein KA254_04965 [Rhodoferax sp.]|nr:hypothetical protein [Rhodoferax sp.]